MRAQIKKKKKETKMREASKNANNQAAIFFSLASDWLGAWCEISDDSSDQHVH